MRNIYHETNTKLTNLLRIKNKIIVLLESRHKIKIIKKNQKSNIY